MLMERDALPGEYPKSWEGRTCGVCGSRLVPRIIEFPSIVVLLTLECHNEGYALIRDAMELVYFKTGKLTD